MQPFFAIGLILQKGSICLIIIWEVISKYHNGKENWKSQINTSKLLVTYIHVSPGDFQSFIYRDVISKAMLVKRYRP